MFNLHNIVKANQALILPVLLGGAKFFYDGKYLTGRHFDNSFIGLRWVLRAIWRQKILGFNRHIPWPCGYTACISNPKNITFHPDDLGNFQSPGTYFQNFSGHITLKRGCFIAPNVGIITANHRIGDLKTHERGKDVVIGADSWIGMNAVILPGVILGDHTVVGAGSVVTKSFPEGNVLIAGNPAKIIKKLNDSEGV
ncbi:acyltransferase [Crenothrix polyspora]|uniref:Capsular polysaccharide synthesis O-acetyltransferase CapJ n=1 Tax=Crenothrix polyspora TaxID=360316 RepID=A0A1R4HBA2_9GAMM|nr:acyltransferase [Crenothrix polyspora]SJM93457.1 Capsular polysaccharide synthesis O-acetyltransferase CapJ [Crenothrix polyspora]